MAEVKWIKIVTDIFDDEKILLIESLPDADAVIVIWFKLLCLAGKQNNQGVFVMSNGIPYTEDMLATIFRRKASTVKMALDVFERFGMINIINDVVTIPNWEKHQSLDKLDVVREQNRKRVANYRERQKQLAECNVTCNVTRNVTVTQCNATDKNKNKNRLDKDIDKDKDNISSSKVTSKYSSDFEEFWSRYPRHQDKGNAFKKYKARLKEGYTPGQLIDAAVNYARECQLEHRESKYIKMGSTFLADTHPFEDYIEGIPATESYSQDESSLDFLKRMYEDAVAEEQAEVIVDE